VFLVIPNDRHAPIRYERSPASVLKRFDLQPALAAEDAYEAANCVFLPARRSIISASVTPLARFIMAMTSAFLLLRSEALSGFFAVAVFFAESPACLFALLDGFAFLRAAFGWRFPVWRRQFRRQPSGPC